MKFVDDDDDDDDSTHITNSLVTMIAHLIHSDDWLQVVTVRIGDCGVQWCRNM